MAHAEYFSMRYDPYNASVYKIIATKTYGKLNVRTVTWPVIEHEMLDKLEADDIVCGSLVLIKGIIFFKLYKICKNGTYFKVR